ncbi:helix-turn-helix domain-containing protein [Enterobacter mori]
MMSSFRHIVENITYEVSHEIAANDLIVSRDKVLDIGFRYGFESQQSFTRSFTKKYNVPPQAYRRLYTEKHF